MCVPQFLFVLLIWFRGSCSPGVLYGSYTLLYCFWRPEGRYLMETFHLELCFPRSVFLCIINDLVYLFVSIWSRRKLPWWWLNTALFFEDTLSFYHYFLFLTIEQQHISNDVVFRCPSVDLQILYKCCYLKKYYCVGTMLLYETWSQGCFLLVVPPSSILLTSISEKEKRKKKKSLSLVILKIVQIFEICYLVPNLVWA